MAHLRHSMGNGWVDTFLTMDLAGSRTASQGAAPTPEPRSGALPLAADVLSEGPVVACASSGLPTSARAGGRAASTPTGAARVVTGTVATLPVDVPVL